LGRDGGSVANAETRIPLGEEQLDAELRHPEIQDAEVETDAA
jgi:hypothetical protein